MSLFRRLFGKKEEKSPPPGAEALDFTPRMPEVEPLDESLVQYARQVAANPAERRLVTLTPGRLVASTDPLPPPGETMPPQAIAELMAIAPPQPPQQIVAIGMTEFKAYSANPQQAIPFIGYLYGLAQLGHAVILFEGHPSAFALLCRDSDLLIVDEAMVPFLQADWLEVAGAVMHQIHILIFERSGRLREIKK